MSDKEQILLNQIAGLKEDKEDLKRDIQDLLYNAEQFAPVYRCGSCDRYTREGYICVHCGTDNSL